MFASLRVRILNCSLLKNFLSLRFESKLLSIDWKYGTNLRFHFNSLPVLILCKAKVIRRLPEKELGFFQVFSRAMTVNTPHLLQFPMGTTLIETPWSVWALVSVGALFGDSIALSPSRDYLNWCRLPEKVSKCQRLSNKINGI